MRYRSFAACAVAYAVGSWAAPASAQTADEQAARALFTEGNELFAAGDYVAALERFQTAYARTSNPKILLNIGTTLKQLGRFAEAATVYETYLKNPKADPARRKEVEAALGELLGRIAVLRLEGAPEGAKITIDGRPVSGGQVRVDRGPHTVVADDGKGPPVTVQVEVAAKEERVVSLKRPDTPPAPAAEPKPASPSPAPAGGDTRPSRGGVPTISYVLIGGGFVAAAIGTGFLFDSKSKYDKADALRQDCEGKLFCSTDAERKDSNDQGDRSKVIGIAGVAVGGAAAAAGILVAVFAPSPNETSFAPLVGPGFAGVNLGRAW